MAAITVGNAVVSPSSLKFFLKDFTAISAFTDLVFCHHLNAHLVPSKSMRAFLFISLISSGASNS